MKVSPRSEDSRNQQLWDISWHSQYLYTLGLWEKEEERVGSEGSREVGSVNFSVLWLSYYSDGNLHHWRLFSQPTVKWKGNKGRIGTLLWLVWIILICPTVFSLFTMLLLIDFKLSCSIIIVDLRGENGILPLSEACREPPASAT